MQERGEVDREHGVQGNCTTMQEDEACKRERGVCKKTECKIQENCTNIDGR